METSARNIWKSFAFGAHVGRALLWSGHQTSTTLGAACRSWQHIMNLFHMVFILWLLMTDGVYFGHSLMNQMLGSVPFCALTRQLDEWVWFGRICGAISPNPNTLLAHLQHVCVRHLRFMWTHTKWCIALVDKLPGGVCVHVSAVMKSDSHFIARKCQDICLSCAEPMGERLRACVCFSRLSQPVLCSSSLFTYTHKTWNGINVCLRGEWRDLWWH